MTRPSRRAPAVCAALALLFGGGGPDLGLGPRGAEARKKRASSKAKQAARRYEIKGKVAYRRGAWEEAIAAFELAYEAIPHPRHLHNIGRAHEKNGDLAAAIEWVDRYIEEETDAEERQDGEATLAILRTRLVKRHAEVTIRTQPSGAVVRLAGPTGELDGTSPMRKWLSVGGWTVVVAKDDLPRVRRRFVVEAGRATSLEIDLRAAARREGDAEESDGWGDEIDESDPSRRPPSPPPPRTSPSTLGPWVALGVGAAALAGGAVFGLLAGQAEQARDDARDGGYYRDFVDEHDTAESHALTANVLLGAGAMAALAGGAWWLVAPADPAAAAAVSPGPAGLVLGGRF